MKTKTITLTILSLIILSFTFKRDEDTSKFTVKSELFSKNDLTIITIKKNSMEFGVTTKQPHKNDFYMNSNFFDLSGRPIGEVVVNGKTIKGRNSGGGFFYTVNGEPMISVGSHPKNVKNCSQTNYVGIINGKINKRVTNHGVNKKDAYRTLIGKNENGDLLIIHSNRMGMVSMNEICEFGIKKGIKTGLIFDGGSSVDVGINGHSFESVPIGKGLLGIDNPPVYIVGNFR